MVAAIGMVALATLATVSEVRYHQNNDATTQSVVSEVEPNQPEDTWENAAPQQNDLALTEEQEVSPHTRTSKIQPAPDDNETATPAQETPFEEEEQPMTTPDQSSSNQALESKSTDASIAMAEATTLEAEQEVGADNRQASSEEIERSTSKDDVAAATPSLEPNDSKVDETACQVRFTHEAMQVMTPNGDYQNDVFSVEVTGVGDFLIQIFNQPGELVFESKDPAFRWGGQDRFGNPVPAGTYFYRIFASDVNGVSYIEQNAKGSIQIFR